MNFAPNPSFEEGLENEKVFDWSEEWRDNADFQWNIGVAHTQLHSLLIRGSVKAGGWTPAGWKSIGFPVFKGKRYTFTSLVKTRDATGDTYLVISWYGPKGWIGNSNNGFSLSGNMGWTKLSVSDIPPKEATYGILYLRSDNNTGSTWFDDVELNITEQNLVDIAVPDNSFELQSGFWQVWQSEGHARNMSVDNTHSFDGRHSLRIDDASGCVAWRSNTLYLDSNTQYQYRFSSKIYVEGNSKGRALIWIAWFGKEGWLGNSESAPLDMGASGWQELVVVANPPKGANSAQLFLGCEDFEGSVWFDDVKLAMMCFPSIDGEQIPLEYALSRHYQSLYCVHPFCPERFEKLFTYSFPDPEDCQKILENLEKYLFEHQTMMDKDLKLTLAILYYHIGDYEKSFSYIRSLMGDRLSFETIDIRNDIFNYYNYQIGQALKKRNARQKAEDAEKVSPQFRAKFLLEAGEGYYDIGEFQEARKSYEKLLSSHLQDIDIPYINYKISLCLFKEGLFKEASERLKEFISIYPHSKYTQQAKLLLVKALRLSGRAREAITLLKTYLQEESTTPSFRADLEKEAGKCYRLFENDPALVEDYKRTFGRNYLPGAKYIGEDTTTLGDWWISYGNYAYILCAKDINDIVGGVVKPVTFTESGIPVTPKQLSPEEVPPLPYSFSTLDPSEPGRMHWPFKSPPPPWPLYDPVSKTYRDTYWDDRGEIRPPGRGPDLLINIRDIPPGIYRLALYMREHEVKIMDDEGNVLAIKPRKEERGREGIPNLYECFVIFGPIDLTIHIVRGKSLCTIISGIFLDRLLPPQALPLEDALKENVPASLRDAIQQYEEMRMKWEEDPHLFYSNLDKLKNIIDTLEIPNSYSSEKSKNPISWWIAWQCYNQLPGHKEKETEAFKSFINNLISLYGREKGKSLLKNIGEGLFTKGELKQGKFFGIYYLQTLWELGDIEELGQELGWLIERYLSQDIVFSKELLEYGVSLLAGKIGKNKTMDFVKKIAEKHPENAPCLVAIAYNKIREKLGQKALTAEEQYLLALHFHRGFACKMNYWGDNVKSIQELRNLLRNYPDFSHRDEVYVRIISATLPLLPSRAQLEEILSNFEKDCPNSPLLPQIYFLIATQYYLRQGELSMAEHFLSLLINKFPNSAFAEQAREQLDELNNYKFKTYLQNKQWR